jgi:nucleoside-diphosphate-sugar epimerase
MKVFVTGANGFVGRATCATLAARGYDAVPAVRSPRGLLGERVVGEVGPTTELSAALLGVDAVVHLAARVHLMRDAAGDPLAAYRRVNTAGTLNLARQAAAAGIRRFVFVSSIKVNGEGRSDPYSESDLPEPLDAYAISKWEAEQGLREIEAATGMQVVILRPPLVYGPAVGANFLRLMQTVAKGWPLPFGRVDNRRSLLYLGNLTDAIRICLEHEAAAGRTYLLCDGEDVSSAELVRRLARAMQRPPRLLPVPPAWLRVAGGLLGRSAEVARLLGSLTVDGGLIRRELGWQPPYSLAQGLELTVDHFLQEVGHASH